MFLKRAWLAGISLLGLAVASAPAALGAEKLDGPYRATIERVVDGDTLAARVTIWIGQDVQVSVRVRGVDAPEMRGRCAGERQRAEEATAALASLVADGPVVLTAIEGDKYFGRVVADVATPQGRDIGDALISAGFARAYDGSARGSWCEIGALAPASKLAQVAD